MNNFTDFILLFINVFFALPQNATSLQRKDRFYRLLMRRLSHHKVKSYYDYYM